VYVVLAVAVFAAAIAAYSSVSAQSSMASVATQTSSVAQSISTQTSTIAESLSDSATDTTSEESTLTVAGLGSVTLAPDMVSLNLGFDTIAPTAQEAVQKNTETMNKILESLKTLGLEEKEVKTSYFSVYPQYTYDPEGKNAPTISGYQASNNVNILTKKADRTAEIIDNAISAGANRVDGPYFSLSTEAQKNLRNEVIEMAKKDAEETANTVLAGTAHSIKGVKSTSISFGGYPIAYLERAVSGISPVYAGQAQLQSAAYIPPPPVLPGEQQVTATVTMTYILG